MAVNESSRAIYFTAPGRVELRQVPLQPVEGGFLVRSQLIGISHGTELLFFNGEAPSGLEADSSLTALDGRIEYPIKYGYINTGITASGGRVFAFYPHQESFYAKDGEVIELPPEMNYDDAVFLAHMETAVSIVQDTDLVLGDTVLIVGQGTIGLLIAEILRRFHDGKIITLEPIQIRREASARLGCHALSPSEDGIADRIRHLAGPAGVDMAINVSGSDAGLQTAIDSLTFGGSVIEASWYGARTVSLSLGREFHRQRLSIRSSQVSTIPPRLRGRWSKRRRLDLALDLIESIKPRKYITHRFKMSEGQAAFEFLQNRPCEAIQVVLLPGI